MSTTPTPGEVFASLFRVVHAIGTAGGQELRGHDLSPAQYQLLVLLHRQPRATQRELTETLGVTKGNVSQLVSRMEEAGLLQRTSAGAANEITLTDSGTALVQELAPAHRRFLARSFSALSGEELTTLATLVTRIEDSL